MPGFDPEGSNLIFIISLPRSGSTLLQRILGGHSQIHTVAEPWLMLHPLYALREKGVETDFDANLARQGLEDFLSQFDDGREVYFESLRQWASALYGPVLQRSGKTLFLDKTPRYYYILPELRQVFPKATFVFLLRNPMAILSSVLKSWFDNQPLSLEGTSNHRDLTEGVEHIAAGIRMFEDQAVILRYEELVCDPQKVVSELCSRIGIPFEPPMLEYGNAAKPAGRHGDQLGIVKHSHAVPDYLHAWQHNLRAAEREKFALEYMRALGPQLFEQLGYDYYATEHIMCGLPEAALPGDDTGASRADAINAEGEFLAAQGDLDGAREKFEQALVADPGFVLGHNNLAVLYWHQGFADKAVVELSKGLTRQPHDRDLVINAGQIFSALGMRDDSVLLYESYLNVFPRDSEIASLLEAISGAEDSDEAMRTAVTAIAGETTLVPAQVEATVATTPIPIITSIAPRGLGKQKRAVQSWLDLGFEVLSLNTRKEIDGLQHEFPGVRFIKATRDGSRLAGKPYVYIDDMLAALKKTKSEVVGIVNSDISLRAQSSLVDYLKTEALGCFLYSSRIDIDHPEDTAGKVYHRGFDMFFFDRSVIDKIPATSFMLGIPWWDYWLPLAPLLHGVTVKRIDSSLGYHVWHETNYSDQQLVQFAREFAKHCKQAPFIDLYQQCADGNYGNVRYSVLSDAALDYLARNSVRLRLPDSVVSAMHQQADKSAAPKLTAIVSTYNSEAFIGDCLNDLVNQTIAEQIEIIVIDAASPQNERAIVEEFQRKYPNIRYQRTSERIGVYAAWNIVAKMAQGEYLITCSTNDRLRNDACEILARSLDERPDVALVYGNSFLTKRPHESFDTHTICGLYVWPEYSYELLTDRCMVGPHPMWRRSVHETVGLFDESLTALGDQEFWLRLGQDFELLNLPDFTGLYYVSESSITGDTDLTRIETDKIHAKYRWRYRYGRWFNQRYTRDEERHRRSDGPLTQIIVVANYLDGEKLANTLDSVAEQRFANWHLTVLSNDACPDPLFDAEGNLEWVQFSAAEPLGQVLNRVTGTRHPEWLCVLEAGERLDPAFLSDSHDYLSKYAEWKLLYCDDDRVDEDGTLFDPRFKPNFNLELLRGSDYIGNAFIVSYAALVEAGGFGDLDGAMQFDLILRVRDRFGTPSIGHLADIRFHRNAGGPASREKLSSLKRKQALEQHLTRCGEVANVEEGVLPGTFILSYSVNEWPNVSVLVVATEKGKHLRACVQTVLDNTDYPNFEVRVLDQTQKNLGAKNWLSEVCADDARVTVVQTREQNEVEALNCFAQGAAGEYLVWLKEEVVAVQSNWLQRLVRQGVRKSVGVVGARVVDRRKSVVSGGVLLGIGSRGVGARSHEGHHMVSPGYMGRGQLAQEMGAVPGLGMLVRKSLFQAVGGYDKRLSVDLYRDIDLCLRVAREQKVTIWTPCSTLVYLGKHLYVDGRVCDEAILEKQVRYFQDRWVKEIASDSSHNRNLSMLRTDFTPEIRAVRTWDPEIDDDLRVLSFGAGSFGSWQYRVKQPLDVLHRKGVLQRMHAPFVGKKQIVLPTVVELERLQPDAILMHNTMHDDFIEAMERYKRANKSFVVFGQDDLMTALPPKNPFSRTIYRDMKQRVRKCLSLADRLVVTTEPLAQALAGMASEIRVVPNYLDGEVWGTLASHRGTGRKARVGWAGAQQHLGDLELLEQVVRETAEEVDWIFFGMCPEFLRPFVKEVHQAVTFEEYPQKLAALNLDLALAPLEHNRFNECKSNLRLLEYGILGWPVIASDVAPYRDAPVCRVSNQPRAWISAIRERIHDMDASTQEGDVLRDWVRRHWLLHRHVDEWLKVLNPAQNCGIDRRIQEKAAGL